MPKHSRLTLKLTPGQTVRITVEAESAADRAPTPCEADILELLSNGRTLGRTDIVAELCQGKEAHGESTVEKALARMVKAGRLSKGAGGVGYRIPAAES